MAIFGKDSALWMHRIGLSFHQLFQNGHPKGAHIEEQFVCISQVLVLLVLVLRGLMRTSKLDIILQPIP